MREIRISILWIQRFKENRASSSSQVQVTEVSPRGKSGTGGPREEWRKDYRVRGECGYL